MTLTTVPATADPDATDDMLATQPIGYWSGIANQVVIKHLRDAMAREDVTQPQWWTLNRVRAGAGPTRGDVVAQLANVADNPHDISRCVDQLLHRGWIQAGPDQRLYLTDSGTSANARILELVTRLRTEIHEGITDAEYVAALKVLRRMIHNIGGPTSLR